ncbi:MAG: carboxypeptidase-like regulatory domain-containing protein [Saprospiraceae bacterium]|nr:carboxypeptidase-like regulatory domain-containing protein [Saprospiraceae bacterium]
MNTILLRLTGLFLSLILIFGIVEAQRTVIKGIVTDANTKEPLAFANVLFSNTSTGTNTDFDGLYTLETSKKYLNLEARYVGYETKVIAVKYGETQVINFQLKPNNSVLNEVLVKSAKQKYSKKNNPAIELIEKVIANKKINRKSNFEQYEYEKYQKLEFALSNVSEKFKNKKIFKNFQFVFDNLDSSKMNGKPLLPVYLKENIWDVYYRKEPKATKEILKGERFVNFSQFIDDKSLAEYFQYLYQDIDIYESNIQLFGNLFLSPIANLSPTFYRFYIRDTVFIDEDSCFQLSFYPKNRTDYLFQGDLFITKNGSYAVKEVRMAVNKEINLNWVKELSIRQRFVKADSLGYILDKDEIMADFGITNAKMGIFGQKNISYKNFKFNQARPDSDYEGPTQIEAKKLAGQQDSFWVEARHDTLTKSEAGVYATMDSLQKLPSFRRIMDIATILLAGYKVAGPVEIGPVNTFYSFNPVEGFRLRVGGRTTPVFSTKYLFESYIAYGFKDQKFKYYLEGTYSFAKDRISVFPIKELTVSLQKDTKIPGQELQFVQEDNFLLSFKRGDNEKWLYNDIYKLQFLNEFKNHTSLKFEFKHWTQHPAGTLHYNKIDYSDTLNSIQSLRTLELGLTFRWAPNEQFFQGKLYRVPLPNKHPIFTLRYGLGLKDVLGGEYAYHNISASLYKRIYFPQFGFADLTLEGGKVFGQVPFPLLYVHRANQTYSYQLNSYNLMNFLEFVSDQYYSVNYNHYLAGALFNKIPLFKKLKWREVFSVKLLYGGVRDENDPALNASLYKFPATADGIASTYTLEEKPYVEASVGIYNIFKIVRVDYVRRLNYLDNPNVSKSGIRARVKFEF